MKFFVLKKWTDVRESPATTMFLEAEPVSVGPAPRCERCGRVIGPPTWLPPYRVELDLWGRKPGDVAFGLGPDLLVSQRFRDLFEAAGLQGLVGFDPVEIVAVKHRKRPQKQESLSFYRTSLKRSQAAVDLVQSGLEGEGAVKCPACLDVGVIKRARRIILEPSTWSGEDLFLSRGLPDMVLASERFKAFCDNQKINNVILLPAEEYGFDDYPWEKVPD